MPIPFNGYKAMFRTHRKHRAKENRRKRTSIRQNKRSFKKNERQVKKYEKQANKFYDKYGAESFKNYDALSPKQQKVHNKLLERASHGLDRSKERLGKAESKLEGRMGLPKEKRLPGMAKLRGIPELGKLKKDEGYSAGKSYLQDLLSGDSDAYNKFASPIMREYERKILPKLADQYAGEGYNSAARGELFESGNDLAERLGRLRGELQLGAIDPSLRYAQANQENQQQRIGNRFAENAQRSGENLEEYNRAQSVNTNRMNRNQLKYGRAQDRYGRAQNDYSRSFNEADTGLRTNPYHSIYRSPTPPILPAEYAQGQTYQPQPSALQRGFQAAAPALGTAFGGAAGGAVGQGLAGAAGNNPAQSQASSYGRTAPQVPQSNFRNYQPNWNTQNRGPVF